MGERMDGWPLSLRREGRGGWREVVLEMEEKKRGDINLAEGRPARLSLPLSLSLSHTDTCAPPSSPGFLSVSSGPLHHIRSRTHRSEGLSSSGLLLPQRIKSKRSN